MGTRSSQSRRVWQCVDTTSERMAAEHSESRHVTECAVCISEGRDPPKAFYDVTRRPSLNHAVGL